MTELLGVRRKYTERSLNRKERVEITRYYVDVGLNQDRAKVNPIVENIYCPSYLPKFPTVNDEDIFYTEK